MYKSNYVLRTVKVHWMYQKCSYREFFNVHYNNALSEFLFVMLNQKLDFSFFDSFIYSFICYACCCSNYSDFLLRHRALVTRLLSQGFEVNRLSNTFKKFYGRHTDPVGQYKKNVCLMFADSIS